MPYNAKTPPPEEKADKDEPIKGMKLPDHAKRMRENKHISSITENER